MKIFIGIVYIAICVFLMAVVLRQEGKQQGLGAIGGGAGGDTYWAKNKGRSREGVLKRMTIAAAVGFILLSIALNLLFKGDIAAATTTEGAQEINMEELTELINQPRMRTLSPGLPRTARPRWKRKRARRKIPRTEEALIEGNGQVRGRKGA